MPEPSPEIQTCAGLVRLMCTALMATAEVTGAEVTLAQVVPPSVVRQIPSCSVPAKTTPGAASMHRVRLLTRKGTVVVAQFWPPSVDFHTQPLAPLAKSEANMTAVVPVVPGTMQRSPTRGWAPPEGMPAEAEIQVTPASVERNSPPENTNPSPR